MVELTAEVVVAGAGPTGLMLANELALAGVDVVVLERLSARTGLSKALNLQPRTAEVLDLRRLLGRAEQRSFATVAEGHFAAIPVSYAGWGTRHPYQVGIPQAEVEAALEERLAEQGVTVLRGHELTGFVQDGDRRDCHGGRRARARGVPHRVRRWAQRRAARPGAAVRRSGGRGHGVVADVVFRVAPSGVPTQWRSMRNLVASHGAGAFSGLIPLGAPGLYRLGYGDRLSRPADMRAKVTDDEVRQVVRDRYGEEVEIEEIRWASRFSDDSRLAARYRVGRVLLAGDAAHIHFAAGGQGLNLGVQDAMNLGWKLAAELRGRAPAGLLDTYESERRPVAARVLDNVAAQSALIPATAEQRAMRALFSELAALPEVQRHLSGLVSGLDIRYPAPPDAHPATGSRLPDLELEEGHATDLFHSGRFVLLATRPVPAPHPEVTVAVVPRLPWPGVTRALIRPDGYVATTTGSTEGWLAA